MNSPIRLAPAVKAALDKRIADAMKQRLQYLQAHSAYLDRVKGLRGAR